MTAAQAIDSHFEPSGHSDFLTLDDLKDRLAGGTLAAALPALMPGADTAAEITGVRLRQEKHRRESASIVLDIDLLSPGAVAPAVRSLVLHYPRTGSDAGHEPTSWWYPADPYLPALQLTGRPDKLLRGGDWRTTDGLGWRPDAGYAARRLGYKPGQRASFLLHDEQSGERAGSSARPMVLKIVRRDAFDDLLHRATVIGASPLGQLIAIPRLIAFSPVQHAFLYEHRTGHGLDTLVQADLAAVRPVLVSEFLRLTGLIHRTDPSGLPTWSARLEMDKSRPLVDQVLRPCPVAGPALLALVTRLGQDFARQEPTGQLIHNDFTARNLLATGSLGTDTPDGQPVALNLIDWDSAVSGPVERDLAAFLSARLLDDDQMQELLDRYGQGTRRRPDRSLINSFISHQRLLKACRRFLVSGADARLLDDLLLVAARLDRNPLAG